MGWGCALWYGAATVRAFDTADIEFARIEICSQPSTVRRHCGRCVAIGTHGRSKSHRHPSQTTAATSDATTRIHFTRSLPNAFFESAARERRRLVQERTQVPDQPQS